MVKNQSVYCATKSSRRGSWEAGRLKPTYTHAGLLRSATILAGQDVEDILIIVSNVRLDNKENSRRVKPRIMESGDKAGKRFTGFPRKPCNL